MARIAPASIHSAALAVGQSEEVDAVFLSCTNLRTLDIIDDLEAVLQKPVLSSNQALAWDMVHENVSWFQSRARPRRATPPPPAW